MNLLSILPEITLFFGALIILMADVFLAKKKENFLYYSHFLSLIFCAIAVFFVTKNFVVQQFAFSDMFVSNSFTSFVKALVIILLTVVIMFSLNFVTTNKKISAEFLALLMIASAGGMILVSANDFMVFYLGLEMQALSLYLLAALNRASAKSSEAGMKYFILGSAGSGILLFGISLIYGFSGTTNFVALTELYQEMENGVFVNQIPVAVMLGFILVITAMFFKIAAAPFHMWAPDVYEGSATIVTTFFATIVKLTAVATLIRLIGTLTIGWIGMENIFILVALLSLAVGSFGAIFQTNLKRLLAYGSVGHVGFILLGIAGLNSGALSASVFYIVVYAFISLGSFGFLLLIKSSDNKEDDEKNNEIFKISSLSGLAKTNPVVAFSIAVLMFSSAGVPPLAGFFSKFLILISILKQGYLITAILAILFSVISAYYYLRIVKIMYFDEPKNIIKLEDVGNAKAIIFVIAILNIVLIAFLSGFLNFITNFLVF